VHRVGIRLAERPRAGTCAFRFIGDWSATGTPQAARRGRTKVETADSGSRERRRWFSLASVAPLVARAPQTRL